jgi:uncharacterized protein with HEPN domain
MPPKRNDTAGLWDMLDAARAVRDFIKGRTFQEYLKDRMLKSAVERQIEIIGEAARHLSESFRLSHPEIPWQKIIVQRHVLAHEYADIEDNLIWKVATVHIPELVKFLEPLITPLFPEGKPADEE